MRSYLVDSNNYYISKIIFNLADTEFSAYVIATLDLERKLFYDIIAVHGDRLEAAISALKTLLHF